MRCQPFLLQRMERRAMCRGPKYSAGSPSSSRRTASITQEEQDRFDNIDPIAIREALAERGIVNGQVAEPEKAGQ